MISCFCCIFYQFNYETANHSQRIIHSVLGCHFERDVCVWPDTIWYLYWFNVFIFGAIALFEIEMRSSVGRLFFSCNYYCALIFGLQTYEHMLICMHAAREKGWNREFYISRRRINALSFILHTILCCFGVKFQCASSALQIYM